MNDLTAFERQMAMTNEFGALVVRLLVDARHTQPGLGKICWKLYDYMTVRSSGALLLLKVNDYWGAEILVRPIIEATAKILFLCLCDADERERRVHEFTTQLPEINRLNRSERAKKTVDATRGAGARWGGFVIRGLILDEADEENLRQKWPRTKRKALERKWTFAEMIPEIDEAFRKVVKNHGNFLTGLAHSYGISSHLIHADDTAIDLVADRQEREIEEKELLDYTHALRIYSDITTMAMLSAMGLTIALDSRHDEFAKVFQLFTTDDPSSDESVARLVERWRPEYEKRPKFPF